MTRRLVSAFAFLVLTLPAAPAALALDEAERLWLVGQRSFADGLYPVTRRTLERFVAEFGRDPRVPAALVLLGKARLALGDAESALEAFRRLHGLPAPGHPLEAKFWEAEALYRLKRFAEARTAYDEVVRQDAAAPFAPDALYGYAWSALELKEPEPATKAFREMLAAWPEHALTPSATFYLGRTLVELKRYAEALPLLADFVSKHPRHRSQADAQYLLAWTRLATGEHRAGIDTLRAFLAAHPSHEQAPQARRTLVDTLARHGNREELAEAYRALMARTPPTAEALYEAGAVAGRLGHAKDKLAAWQRLRAEFPEHALGRRAALELATAAFERKEWKDAATHARAASESEDETVRGEAFLLLGESELKLRRWASAAKAFEAVGDMADAEPGKRYRALAGLGLAREEQRELRGALEAYEAVATESPDATLRDWARERATVVKRRLERPAPKPAATKKNGRS